MTTLQMRLFQQIQRNQQKVYRQSSNRRVSPAPPTDRRSLAECHSTFKSGLIRLTQADVPHTLQPAVEAVVLLWWSRVQLVIWTRDLNLSAASPD
jgi:hypothetical protein